MSAAKNTVTKKDMIERISERTGVRRADVKIVLQEFLDEIINDLGLGRRLEFREFGVFEVRRRAARGAQNPKTLAPVQVPAKNTVKFKAGRRMKDVIDAASLAEGFTEIKPETPSPTGGNSRLGG